MRSLWVKAKLLTIYLVLVFLLCRLLDPDLRYHDEIPSNQIVDASLLSVRQLKHLLEHRGVSYAGYLEKKDLAQLVEASADVVQSEVEELSQVRGGLETDRFTREHLPTPPPGTRFESGTHFYEELKDTENSVWLVQVVQHKKELLDDDSWRNVHTQVAPFGIRTGVLDCNLARGYCSRKGWDNPMLLLALPKWTRAKDRFEFITSTYTQPQAIVEWLQDHFSFNVKKIRDIDELTRHWLHSGDVKVLLLTHLTNPPLFLSALGITFFGRVMFGMFSIKKEDSDEVRNKLKMPDLRIPSYIIITPERTVVYGRRRSEHFNFASMNFFLRTLRQERRVGFQPQKKDWFLCSLLLVNMLVMLQVFQVSLPLRWKHAVRCFWTAVSYNFWLFFVWLLILLANPRSVSFVGGLAENVARYLSLTERGSLLRPDLQVLTEHPYLLFFTFIVYGFVIKLLVRWDDRDEAVTETDTVHPPRVELPRNSHRTNRLSRPMSTRVEPEPPSELEPEDFAEPEPLFELRLEDLQMLFRRLALQRLRLQECVKNLPVWEFGGECPTEECVICSDSYKLGELVCGLPCDHNYHKRCIMDWLLKYNHDNCPLCRWPAYRDKNITSHPHQE